MLSCRRSSRRSRCRCSACPARRCPRRRTAAGRVAAGGEWFVRSRGSPLRRIALRLGEHDVGRNQAGVAASLPLNSETTAPTDGKRQALAGCPAGLHRVGGRFVRVVAVGHAADEGVLVGLLGQQRQQFADEDARHVGRNRCRQRAAEVVTRGRFRDRTCRGATVRPTSRSGSPTWPRPAQPACACRGGRQRAAPSRRRAQLNRFAPCHCGVTPARHTVRSRLAQ